MHCLSTKHCVQGITLDFNLDPHLPTHIISDKMRFNQVLTNLGTNAVKFTEKGCVQFSAKQLYVHHG
jgi:signal transduction histidine kinase